MNHKEKIQKIIEIMSNASQKYAKKTLLGVENFEELYPEISDFVKKIELSNKKHCVIIAKVKSGKRIVKELLSIRSSLDKKHIYLS